MKRILIFILAALFLAVLLTSCTGNGTGDGTIETNSVVTEPDAAAVSGEESTMPEGDGTTESTPGDNSEGNWTKNY